MRDIDCMRCGARMKYMFRENLQLGKTGWILGDLPNLFAVALCFYFFVLLVCVYLYFYFAEGYDSPQDDELPKKTCPDCGKEIDFDSPKCPFCRYEFRYL